MVVLKRIPTRGGARGSGILLRRSGGDGGGVANRRAVLEQSKCSLDAALLKNIHAVSSAWSPPVRPERGCSCRWTAESPVADLRQIASQLK
jgi:hypothetical protein